MLSPSFVSDRVFASIVTSEFVVCACEYVPEVVSGVVIIKVIGVVLVLMESLVNVGSFVIFSMRGRVAEFVVIGSDVKDSAVSEDVVNGNHCLSVVFALSVVSGCVLDSDLVNNWVL